MIEPMTTLTTIPPERRQTDTGVRVSATIADTSLWFEVEAEYAHLLSDTADAVAVGLLMPAMKYGRDLHVGGRLTDVLLHQLNGDVQRLIRSVYPEYQIIDVSTDECIPPAPPAPGVAAGFSGGVDSFAVLTEYLLADDVPTSLRLTHLINNNVGAHGDGGYELWRARYAGLARFTDTLGLPFVRVDSNLDEHFVRMGFLQTATTRNAAVAHLLGGGIGRLYYASGCSFSQVGVSHHSLAGVDPILLPLLSTPQVTLSSANSGMSRVEKTLALIGRPEARYLDVCIDWDPTRTINCSRCWKCMRTMLTLEIAGHLDEFCPHPFEMAPYAARRSEFLAEVLASPNPLLQEIVEFAAAQPDWRWGLATRGRASANVVTARAHRTARRVAALPGVRDVRRRLRCRAAR